MHNGTVKWYDRTKRFGFITTEDGTDLYVHSTALPPTTKLHAGDVVEFTVEETERGPQAAAVGVVKAADRPDPGRGLDLLDQVATVLRRLEQVAETLRDNRSVSGEIAFYTARDLRRLASRLNPPAQ